MSNTMNEVLGIVRPDGSLELNVFLGEKRDERRSIGRQMREDGRGAPRPPPPPPKKKGMGKRERKKEKDKKGPSTLRAGSVGEGANTYACSFTSLGRSPPIQA